MSDDIKKDLCECDPNGAPDHTPDAHNDEDNGPGATGWINPLHNAPESATYDDTADAAHGPGVPVPGGPGWQKD